MRSQPAPEIADGVTVSWPGTDWGGVSIESQTPYGAEELRLTLGPGQCCAIVGGCGTGKSRIARALVGASREPDSNIEVAIDGSHTDSYSDRKLSQLVAYVPTNLQAVFSGMAMDVAGEIRLSLQLLGVPTRDQDAILDECADTFGITHLLRRNPFSLSGGESVRAALAVALVKRPRLSVLDQIYDHLDPAMRTETREMMSRFAHEGCIFIETHAVSPDWIDKYDQVVFLVSPTPITGAYSEIWKDVDSQQRDLLPPLARVAGEISDHLSVDLIECPLRPSDVAAVISTGQPDRTAAREMTGSRQPSSLPDIVKPPLLQASDLAFEYDTKAEFRLGPIDFAVNRCDFVGVLGPNGAGKTTLLKCLGALVPTTVGTVVATASPHGSSKSPHRGRLHEWARVAQYCFQNPNDQLYLTTVRDELSTPGPLDGSCARRVSEVAAQLGIAEFLDTSPLDAPYPVRRLITIGTALVAAPPVLLLDEPTASLDMQQRARLARVLREYCATGNACVAVSHDFDFLAEVVTRLVSIENGAIGSDVAVHDLCSWPFADPPTCWLVGDSLAPPVRTLRLADLISLVPQSS